MAANVTFVEMLVFKLFEHISRLKDLFRVSEPLASDRTPDHQVRVGPYGYTYFLHVKKQHVSAESNRQAKHDSDVLLCLRLRG